MHRLQGPPTPGPANLLVWGGLLWVALSLTFGCADNTNEGRATTDTQTAPDGGTGTGTTPDAGTSVSFDGGDACICSGAMSTCPGTVTGTVTDFDTRQRLAGVRISGNQSGEAVETDTEGSYELEANVCRSPYILTATLPGYCERTDTLEISGRRTINSDVQLEQRFVAGAVVDITPSGLTGEPVGGFVEGIRVSLSDTSISDTSDELGGFLLEKLPGEGQVTLLASEARSEGEGCYENTIVERVETCQGGSGVVIEMYCRDEANNGCGLCCMGTRALPEGVRPGEPCIREEPCAVGENPVWVCDDDLRGATCSCNACPEDNSRGEVCDGRDNDCDGTTDNPDSAQLLEACEGLDGAFVTGCMDGRCTYACESEHVDINGDLDAGTEGDGCECALSGGGVEVCDGLDNDCNGTVDDIASEPLCAVQQGICAGATAMCTNGEAQCSEEDYVRWTQAQDVRYEGREVLELTCDDADNNCDGRVDEHCCLGIGASSLTAPVGIPANTRWQRNAVIAAGSDAVVATWTQQSAQNDISLWLAAQNLLGTPPTAAQQNLSPDSTEPYRPFVVWTGSGFALTYTERSSDFTVPDSIVLESIDAQGERMGDVRTLAIDQGETAVRRSFESGVASAEDGRFSVLWTQFAIGASGRVCEHPDRSARCLRVRTYDSNGVAQGDVFELTPTEGDTHSPTLPQMAVLPDGSGAMVLWRNQDRLEEIHWRLLDGNLEPSNRSEIMVLGGNVQLAALEGGYMLVYFDNSANPSRLGYRIIGADGAVISMGFIGDGAADQAPLSLIALDATRLALLWTEADSLLYAVITTSGSLESGPTPLFSGLDVSDASMDVLRDPQDPARVLGLVLAVQIDDRIYLGRINPDGHFMCFNP